MNTSLKLLILLFFTIISTTGCMKEYSTNIYNFYIKNDDPNIKIENNKYKYHVEINDGVINDKFDIEIPLTIEQRHEFQQEYYIHIILYICDEYHDFDYNMISAKEMLNSKKDSILISYPGQETTVIDLSHLTGKSK